MAFALVTLALTIAVPIAAIILESAHIPDVVLGTKAINAGPSGTKTLTFGLLTSPNDAVLAAAYISIAAGVICACGIAFVRHIPRYSFVLGCVMITAALGNFLAQIGCTVCWAVWQGKRDGKTAAPGEVSYVDGNYETGGRLFTREAWACTMEKYFGEREGSWASKACSDLKTARYTTIGMIVCGLLVLGITCWVVRMQSNRRNKMQKGTSKEVRDAGYGRV